ncbi:MAG: PP2C family protein-serine/threonine phosphatase [Coprococcus sp.]
MDYIMSAHSDIGIKKETNQDAVLAVKANTDIGKIALLVICDGMGGLAKGELASAMVIRSFQEWFRTELRKLSGTSINEKSIRKAWLDIISNQNNLIQIYGISNGIKLGTTLACILLYEDNYLICNIGDSRVYRINSDISLMTKDHSYVQMEIDAGRMTPEEAEISPKRSIIMQCIGASEDIYPDFFSGKVENSDIFVVCSDGFRHKISTEELYQYLNPKVISSEINMLNNVKYLTELNKHRQETDNISVAIAKVI